MKSTDDLVVGHVDDHKLSVSKFIPLGQLVSRMAIHLFSLIFLEDCVISPDPLYHHHLDVIHRVVPRVEVGGNWLLCLLVSDISAVTVHSFIQCLLCLTHVLAAAFLALDEVDEVGGLAGGGGPHIVALPSHWRTVHCSATCTKLVCVGRRSQIYIAYEYTIIPA